MEYIRAAEGVYHLEKEIRLGLPHAEVIVFDGHFERVFYPDRQQFPIAAIPSSGTAISTESSVAHATPTGRPLIERIS